jgi:hypothetical protein
MYRSLLTLTLAGTLALATLGEAGPRARSTPTTSPHLTDSEFVCQHLGTVAYGHAELRDAGVPYLSALESLRRMLAQKPASSPVLVWFNDSMLRTLRMVYDMPTLTPAQARQSTELGCLRAAERTQASATTMTKDRY